MKKIITFILTVCMSMLLSVVAFGVTTQQVKPNHTPNTAQTILRNTITPAEFAVANYSNQQVLSGSISSGVEDWYKVYLPANNETVLMINASNTTRITADVYRENNLVNHIFSEQFNKPIGKNNGQPHYVNIQAAGWYYIRLHSHIGGSNFSSYLMTIGNPDYNFDTYDHSLSTMQLSATSTAVQSAFNLSSVSSFHRGAVVHKVSMGGTKSGTVTSERRGIKHQSDTAFTSSSLIGFSVDIAPSLDRRLASNWTFQWEGTARNGATLTPKITFRYIYPLTPDNY